MRISHPTIEYLTGIITGDSKKSEYRSGPQLVDFFNSLGEEDTYGQGFPSRSAYTQSKLEKFNNTEKIKQVIEYCFYPIHFIKDADKGKTLLQEINQYLLYDNLKLVETKKSVQLMNIGDELLIGVDSEYKIFKKDSFGLFISHRDSIKKSANLIKGKLQFYGVSSFVAHEDIEPSEDWIKEIEKALFSMDALLALLSDGFSSSVWTNQEVGVAYGIGKFVLSVRLGEDPQGFVGKFQALRPKTKEESDIAKQVVAHLLTHEKTKQKMQYAYFYALSKTSTYAESETWAELLQNITSVSEEAISILIESYNNNSQAYDCHVLNGGRYGNMETIADKINKWIGVNKYKLADKIIKVVP
jgi:hypothetical protein